MGLDTSHDAWHGAYSAFSRWRNGLARAAGYEIAFVSETYDGPRSEMILIDWAHLPVDPAMQGVWTNEPIDALLYLLAHSDCDGFLSPERCARLADRLEELIPLLSAEPDFGHIGDWRQKTRTFVDGLRAASAAHETLEFH